MVQAAHEELPAVLVLDPGLQALHTVLATAAEYVPEEHKVQVDMPTSLANLPAPQAAQLVLPPPPAAVVAKPEPQTMHTDAAV